MPSLAAIFSSLISPVGLLFGLLVFFASIALFSRGESSSALRGLLRVAAYLVVAPLRYLRRIARQVARIGVRDESSDGAREPFILVKLLEIQRAVVFVLSAAIVSGGVVMAVNALLPDPGLRRERREVREALEQQVPARDSIRAALAASRARPLVPTEELAVYRAPHEATVRRTEASMLALAAEANARPELAPLMRFFEDEVNAAPGGSEQLVDRTHSRLRRYLDRASWIGDESNPITQWLAFWRQRELARLEIAAAPAFIESRRKAEIANWQRNFDTAEAEVVRLQGRAADIEKVYGLRPGGFIATVISVFFAFVVWMWVMGVVTESFGLAIELAGDVRELRNRAAAANHDAGQRLVA